MHSVQCRPIELNALQANYSLLNTALQFSVLITFGCAKCAVLTCKTVARCDGGNSR